MELKETFQKVKTASNTLSLLSDDQRNEILQAVADAIIAETPALLAANAEDLAKMDKANPLYDRLQLTEQRLQDIASDMRHVSTLPSPLGRVLKDKTWMRMAMPQMVVTMYPVAVNWCRILSILVPVLSKKLRNTGICRRKTQPVMSNTNRESMMRSVTTVPKDLGNEIPSQRFSTPQRANSPMRGTSRLRA